jgi:hypothetical protein
MCKLPTEDIFQSKTHILDDRMLGFDEEHFLLAKYQCMASANNGERLLEVIQGLSLLSIFCSVHLLKVNIVEQVV